MHEQGISSAEEQESESDYVVMGLLLHRHPGLWTVEEVDREVGDRIEVQDSLARLHGVGLIHRIGGFVFASRAAAHSDGLGRG